MASHSVSRRDFLKLLAMLSVLPLSRFDLNSWQAATASSPASERVFPNILIVLFDTLSARHMSLYGYQRETTPNLARFAERATVYQRNYSTGNFTTASTASLLTGAYPWSHRAFHFVGMPTRRYSDANIFAEFDNHYHTDIYTHNLFAMMLLQRMRAHINGFRPTGDLTLFGRLFSEWFTGENFAISTWSESLIRGFNHSQPPSSLFFSILDKKRSFNELKRNTLQYLDRYPEGIANNFNAQFFLLEDSIDWISRHVSEMPQPYLGYYHLWPPHEPYTTRAEFIGRFNDGWTPLKKPTHMFSDGSTREYLVEQRQKYDEYLAFADAEFGRLYAQLQRQGALENTYLIVTSDHGEMFERGIFGHDNRTLYEALIHVPLLIAAPGQRQRQDVFSLTSGIDLLPTLLYLVGEPVPPWCEGQVLPPFGGDDAPDRTIFAMEAKENPKLGPLSKATVALLRGNYKLVHYFGYKEHPDAYELYDLLTDPEELDDLYPTHNKLASNLTAQLSAKLAEVNQRAASLY